MALWERQEGESKVAYDAFWAYCTTPEGEKRTLLGVAKKLQKTYQMIQRWSKRWNWEPRALAYDNHLVDVEIEALKKQRVEAAKRHAKIAQSFQGKILKRLANLNPDELSPRDLTGWLDVAVKIERQALGEPAEVIAQQLTGKDGGPLEIKRDVDLSKLSEEELIALEKILVKIDGSSGSASSASRSEDAPPKD